MSLLELRRLTKSFAGSPVLKNIDFDVQAGEVHAVIGENGAGKSTLIKLLSGVYRPDSGTLAWEGQPIKLHNPQEAQRLGIRTLHQESSLLPELAVAENIFLGEEPHHRWLPMIDWGRMRDAAADLLASFNADIAPDARVRDLNIAQQQIVEIVKIVRAKARLIVMDEPTATLARREADSLFRLIASIKQQGVGVLYVTHRLEEIFQIADRVTVLRDGKRMLTIPTADCSLDQLMRLMAGKVARVTYHKLHRQHSLDGELTSAPVVLQAERLGNRAQFHGVSFKLHSGEILGLTGALDSGLNNLVRALAGVEPIKQGRMFIDGQAITLHSPQDAVNLGIGLLPADRHAEALMMDMPTAANISLASLARSGLMIDQSEELTLAQQYIDQLHIKPPDKTAAVRQLSGGNQQKVVLARWLAVQARILIAEEPTRGIDVNAKVEIYRLLAEAARRGAAILVVSSELNDLLTLCDRVLTFAKGSVTSTLRRDELSEESLLRALGIA